MWQCQKQAFFVLGKNSCHHKIMIAQKIQQPIVLTITNCLLFIPVVHSVLDTAQ